MNQSAASIHLPTDPNSNSKSHADSLNKKIMIIGSTCVDIIINIDHLPKTEENIHPSSQSLALGGCAYNVASMVKQFGVPVTLISPVGTGFYGELWQKNWRKTDFRSPSMYPARKTDAATVWWKPEEKGHLCLITALSIHSERNG